MKIKNASVEEFIKYIAGREERIAVFGLGVIAHTLMNYICEKSKLGERIEIAVDNDKSKIGKQIELGKTRVIVQPVEALKKIDSENYIIVITGSHYYEMLCQLEKMGIENAVCYILPIMCTSHLNLENKAIKRESKEQLIPKKIHYMWFGSKELPKHLQKCVDSWKRFCPDYKIIRWDEHNYDVTKNNYMKQAYESRQWGFIPDYARLDILYENGGIYIDTDVELICGLDDMLYQTGFTSTEKWHVINIGGGTGCIPGHPAIKKILDVRKNVSFIEKDGSYNRMASGYYDTLPFLREGFCMNGQNQSISGMNIYGFDYFHPYDYMTGELHRTENTLGIHHFNGGWLDENMRSEREKSIAMYHKTLERMKELT